MTWTALLPLKPGKDRKGRLAEEFSPEERFDLAERMACHVTAVLKRTSEIAKLFVLSPAPPMNSDICWRADRGRGLNVEIEDFRVEERPARLLVIHGDLPLLRPEDVRTLLNEADSSGAGLAPDRHGTGTNALALSDERPFRFCFGPNSRSRHLALNPGLIAIVERLGLQFDIDTPDDVRALKMQSPDIET